VVVTREHQIERGRTDQLVVLTAIGVRHRDHQIGAGCAQLRRHGFGGLDRIGERDRPGRGLDRGARRGQPEQAHPVVADVDHQRLGDAVDQAAVRLHGVVGQQRELSLGDPLRQDLRAEVELVVADRHGIDADAVEQVDHVRALVEPGEQGWRDAVAAMGHQDVGIAGADLLDHAPKPGNAALAVALLHPVEVVEVHDLERDRLGRGDADPPRQGQRRCAEQQCGPSHGGSPLQAPMSGAGCALRHSKPRAGTTSGRGR
jgi:hypothetical protein